MPRIFFQTQAHFIVHPLFPALSGHASQANAANLPSRAGSGISRTAAILFCLLLFTHLAGCTTGKYKGSSMSTKAQYDEGQLVLIDGRPANDASLLLLAEKADYILVGEFHDRPLDHQVQARILSLLAKSGKNPLLGLEMAPASSQPDLDGFNSGKVSVDAFPQAVNWQKIWGFDFALYRPVFEAAARHNVPVFGLNIPQDVRESVRDKGVAGLTAEEKRWMPQEIIPPVAAQKEKLHQTFTMHSAIMLNAMKKRGEAASAGQAGSKAPMPGSAAKASPPSKKADKSAPSLEARFERFLLIQSLWDSTMAEQAIKAHTRSNAPDIKGAKEANSVRPMVILAGGGHVEYGYGIAHRLRAWQPDARVLLIMPFSGDAPDTGAADLFFYSSPRSRTPFGFTFAAQRATLRIEHIEPDSRAEKAGLRVGDTLAQANGKPVQAPADLHQAAMLAKQQGTALTFEVLRKGKPLVLIMPKD